MAMHLRKRRPDSSPHHPFWKDERLIGRHVKAITWFRVLLVTIVAFVCVVGYTLFALIDYLGNAHQSRLEAQQRTDREIAQVRKEYDAKVAQLQREINALKVKLGEKPTAKKSHHSAASPSPSTSRHVVIHRGGGSSSGPTQPVRTHPQPTPTPSPSPSPTKPTPSPPPIISVPPCPVSLLGRCVL